MNWESLAGPGLMLALSCLGGYGAYVRLSTRYEGHKAESDRRFGDVDADRKDLRLRLEAIDREAARRSDLISMKSEIIERVKEAEHNFRSDQAKAIGEMTGMCRSLIERVLGAKA